MRGDNAIKMASAIISRLKTGRIDEETTANIGVIKAKWLHIISDLVELEGGSQPFSRRHGHQEEMMKIIEEAAGNTR